MADPLVASEVPPAPPRKRSPLAKAVAGILLLTTILVAWTVGIRLGITTPDELLAAVRGPFEGLGPWTGPAVYAGSVFALVCLAPSPVVAVTAGAILGPLGGLTTTLAAIGTAVLVQRWMGRTLVGAQVQAHMHRRYPGLDARMARSGLFGIIGLRLLGTPPTALAYASSATALPPAHLSAGCVVGTVPRGFAYASIGASGGALWPPSEWSTEAALALLILGVASIVALAIAWVARDRTAA